MRLLIILLLAFCVSQPGAVLAQKLPNHFDPRSREQAPNLAGVPALRFLTTTDFPPFNYRDTNGELIGFNIDLARAICTDLNIACTVQAWPWEQAADALADNQGDALIAGLAITPQTGARFDFSSIYLALPGRFVAARDMASGLDPRHLQGAIVAVRAGSAHATFARRYLPGAIVLTFDDEIAALGAVEAGIAGLYFGDALRAAFWLNGHVGCCAFAGPAFFRPGLFGEGLAIALPAGRDADRAAVNWALRRLKRDGVLDEIYLRWFPVSFY